MSFRMTCAFFCIYVKKNQLQTYRWMKSVCKGMENRKQIVNWIDILHCAGKLDEQIEIQM